MGIGFGYKVGFDWFMCLSMGWFTYVKGIGQVYGYKGVAAYVGICGV